MQISVTSNRTIGYLSILASAIFFYLATLILKRASEYENISPIIFVHFRFLLGFLIFFPFYWIKRKSLKTVNRSQLVIRSFTNGVAVFCFFSGVHYGSVTNANLLNMTYPAFVALFSPFLAGEKNRFRDFFAIFFTLIGASLIFIPGTIQIQSGDIFSLLSAVFAGWAIVSLRIVRKTDPTLVILVYVFGFGSLLFSPVYFFYPLPKNNLAFYHLFFSSISGILGQVFLTYGYRFVKAVEGSIISSSRIIIALIVGAVFLNDPINAIIISGAFLIILSHYLEATGRPV